MEVDREIEAEKNDEKKERLKEENHVSYMQTDVRMTILFYRNAILLKCLQKKRDRESTTVYSMRTFRASGTCETFLSFNLYVVRVFVIPTTTRSGFAKYKLHIYDKHHTIFTTQYTNSLAFLDTCITI